MEGYFRPNQQTLEADANRANREGNSGYKPAETRMFDAPGQYHLFVMPPWDNTGQMRREIGWHWQCHPMRFPVPCLKFWDHDCPICNVLETAMIDFSADEERRKEIIRRMAKTRIYVNAIEVKMRDNDPGNLPNLVQVWEFPIKVYNAVARVLHDYPDALDPTAAFMLKVTKTKPTSKDGFPDYQSDYIPADKMVNNQFPPRLQPWVVDQNGNPHSELIAQALKALPNLQQLYYNPKDELEDDIRRAADAVNSQFYGSAKVGSVPPMGRTGNPGGGASPGGSAPAAGGSTVSAPASAPAAGAPAASAPAAGVPGNNGDGTKAPISPDQARRYPENVDPNKYPCYGGIVQNDVATIGFTPDSDTCLKCPHQAGCQAEIRQAGRAQA